ncbi:MarR family winged helix-turn-helix transcriptional regulator [Tessaracoccus caeni]|uniref:MarR family winged helix-turn-helix transcriptional regulator n=1 Tax=Tessaracoccus caeni TaxID=3031239 RepID=UPI0023DC5559|nr:MarR family transcriptional regulator [Tessaracoccus caeni]MDF1489733.1 MarR family transcriptional regulator [Tessaracoccus caeni]
MLETPDADLTTEESAALAAVAKSFGLLRRAAERNLAEHGELTRVQFEILSNLLGAPSGLRMFELADRLVVSRSGLTYQVKQLEKAGLLIREEGADGQRSVSARITDAGRELLTVRRAAYAQLIRSHFIDSFTPDELATVTTAFTRVVESFGSECPPPPGADTRG